jgi:hypothetical protein
MSPAFTASPFDIGYGLQPGIPGYSFGALSFIVDNTNAYVTNVALTSNVATVNLTIRDGAIPVANQLISIRGSQVASGVFNVVNVAISTVTGFTTGDKSLGAVTFPLTHANVASTPDTGLAAAPPLETGDAITPATPYQGQAFALAPVDVGGNSRSIAWRVSFPATPPTTSFEADLIGSIKQSGPYSKLDKITNVAGASQVYEPLAQINFVRIDVITNDAATAIIGVVCI